MPEQIDGIDAKILHLIQGNAALSVADIADKVGLSSSPCWRRITRMEELGIIKQRVTILNREKLGLAFEVFLGACLAILIDQGEWATDQSLAAADHRVAARL